MLQNFQSASWDKEFSETEQANAITALETGNILFFPTLTFSLLPHEEQFLNSQFVDPHAKNISYHADSKKLWGVQHLTDQQHIQLKGMMDRFCKSAQRLIRELFPTYTNYLQTARTSYRPIQIKDRKTSYRKDDKRLHVDAFPSAPNQGRRILRVFCNINPSDEARIWRVGETFEEVVRRFLPEIRRPLPGKSHLLRLLRITKSYRSLYDHYMLQLHDSMKANEQYQKTAHQQEIHFPAQTTWIVQTDDVSHAAMHGQYVLEQTFYLPVGAMQDESRSPLRILESYLQQPLV